MADGVTSTKFFLIALLLFTFTAVTSQVATTNNYASDEAILITVDQSGEGDYWKIQDAIDAVPSNNAENVYIAVKPGTYTEKIWVPADKPFITIAGAGPGETIITWSQGGEIYDTPTFTVLASDFTGRTLTIQNTYGKGARAVALRASGDRAAFYDCSIKSYQDTLLSENGKQYYSNCYIEGAVDFIFGSSAALFQNCHLHSTADEVGFITAHRRDNASENLGFSFVGCKISGLSKTTLGRPWSPYSRVIFALTHMSNVVAPQGWDDWGRSPDELSTVYFGQYRCWGAGADTSQRVKWARELTFQEAAPLMTSGFIGGTYWLRQAPTRFKSISALRSSNVTAAGNN
ncbi:unnamed protein product [Malus baccata var. baccata]